MSSPKSRFIRIRFQNIDFSALEKIVQIEDYQNLFLKIGAYGAILLVREKYDPASPPSVKPRRDTRS
jgi:hypothetical protein